MALPLSTHQISMPTGWEEENIPPGKRKVNKALVIQGPLREESHRILRYLQVAMMVNRESSPDRCGTEDWARENSKNGGLPLMKQNLAISAVMATPSQQSQRLTCELGFTDVHPDLVLPSGYHP
jgi:hypothetical protein